MFSTTNRRHRRAQWVALGLFSIGLGLLASLGWPSLDLDGLWPPIWRSAVRAGLSATLSCLFGWLLAHSAIYAMPEAKPRLWLALLNTIPVMPTLVVVLMLIAFYGRNGLLAQALIWVTQVRSIHWWASWLLTPSLMRLGSCSNCCGSTQVSLKRNGKMPRCWA